MLIKHTKTHIQILIQYYLFQRLWGHERNKIKFLKTPLVNVTQSSVIYPEKIAKQFMDNRINQVPEQARILCSKLKNDMSMERNLTL